MTATQEIGWGELDRLNAVTIRRPLPVRDRWGRWKRCPGGEWDWFYALPEPDQDYIRRHHMSDLGVMPDELATLMGTDVDTAMDQWTEAVALTRKRRLKLLDPLSEEWEDETVYDDTVSRHETARNLDLVGPGEVAQRLGVTRNLVQVWRGRGLMPEPIAVLNDGRPGFDGRPGAGMPVWLWEDVQAAVGDRRKV